VVLLASHLFRAFEELTKLQQPCGWRLAAGIERARELLEGADRQGGALPAAVAFDDPSGFASTARKAAGVTSGQYRWERRS
jgi:AraC-like DNA-binding protein